MRPWVQILSTKKGKKKARKHYPRIHEHLGAQVCGSHHFCFSNYIFDFMKSLYKKCDYFWYHIRKFYQVSLITGYLYTHIIKLKLGQIFDVFESLIENNSVWSCYEKEPRVKEKKSLIPILLYFGCRIGLQGLRNFQTFHLKMKNYTEHLTQHRMGPLHRSHTHEDGLLFVFWDLDCI